MPAQIKLLNPTFHFQPNNINTTNADLYLEINAQEISYVIIDKSICLALVVYHFKTGTSDEVAADYFHQVVAGQPVLQQKFNKVHIIYGYPPSLLVPQQFLNNLDHSAILELVFGNTCERVTRTDFLQGHEIHNVYGIPSIIEQVVNRYFGFAECIHLFSILPEIVKEPGNHLFCIFSSGQLKMILTREGEIQVLQTFVYTTPDDVAYHLLNTCNSFEVHTNDVMVGLSGMIDERSPLYSELYKYFIHLKFETLPDQYQYPDEIREYPAHYFSHLFSVAACV